MYGGVERRRSVDGQTALKHGVLPRWRRSMIRGGDAMIPSPEMSPEQRLQGTCLHDPLHGRQTWFESFRAVPFQNGEKKQHQAPSPLIR